MPGIYSNDDFASDEEDYVNDDNGFEREDLYSKYENLDIDELKEELSRACHLLGIVIDSNGALHQDDLIEIQEFLKERLVE